jgi:hypothetical protein
MNDTSFQAYLRRGGRTDKVAAEVVNLVEEYQVFLATQRAGRRLQDASPDDLTAFVAYVEATPKRSARSHLWAISYYYTYAENKDMHAVAACHALFGSETPNGREEATSFGG